MKHCQCVNYINLDCEKGLCALSKGVVPIDGEGSDACPRFEEAPFCGNCIHFESPDSHGLGRCTLRPQGDWAYATCGAFSCKDYQKR